MCLVFDYLTNRKGQTKTYCYYSSWKELLFAVPQGLALDRLLLCVNLYDLCLLTSKIDICSDYLLCKLYCYLRLGREYKLHQSHWSQTLSDLSFKLISGNHLKANEERYALLSTNKIVLQNIDKSPSKTVVVKNY